MTETRFPLAKRTRAGCGGRTCQRSWPSPNPASRGLRYSAEAPRPRDHARSPAVSAVRAQATPRSHPSMEALRALPYPEAPPRSALHPPARPARPSCRRISRRSHAAHAARTQSPRSSRPPPESLAELPTPTRARPGLAQPTTRSRHWPSTPGRRRPRRRETRSSDPDPSALRLAPGAYQTAAPHPPGRTPPRATPRSASGPRRTAAPVHSPPTALRPARVPRRRALRARRRSASGRPTRTIRGSAS